MYVRNLCNDMVCVERTEMCAYQRAHLLRVDSDRVGVAGVRQSCTLQSSLVSGLIWYSTSLVNAVLAWKRARFITRGHQSGSVLYHSVRRELCRRWNWAAVGAQI